MYTRRRLALDNYVTSRQSAYMLRTINTTTRCRRSFRPGSDWKKEAQRRAEAARL